MKEEYPRIKIENGNLSISVDIDELIFALENQNRFDKISVIDKQKFEKDLLNTLQNPIDMNEECLGVNAVQGFFDRIFHKLEHDGAESLDFLTQPNNEI